MSKERTRIRPEKEAIVDEIRAEVDSAPFVLLTDFSGLNMGQTSDLRSRLRKVGGRYRVVRNRWLRKAVQSPALASIADDLTGATAVVTGEGDGIEVARTLLTFIKEHERPGLKTSVFDGAVIAPEDVRALGDLPTLPVLQAMLVGVLAAPMTRLAGVLQQKLGSLVYVLKAVEEKKGGAEAATSGA